MEMISAVKMRKAVAAVQAIRPYAESTLAVLARVSGLANAEEVTWLKKRETKNVLIVAITSNRGLCGSFNAQVFRQVRAEVERLEKELSKGGTIHLLSLGKRGDRLFRRLNKEIVASFPDVITVPNVEAVRPVAKVALDAYAAETYDKVILVYTDFVSAVRQETKVRRLLPLSQGAIKDEIGEMKAAAKEKNRNGSEVAGPAAEYVIEPNPEQVLRTLIPRLVEMQLYHAILESNASQEASRMMAMRNATDAATEMVSGLTLAYNQLRQAKVTQEIAELSAGMAAVEG